MAAIHSCGTTLIFQHRTLFVFLTILRTKCNDPPFALHFVRDDLIVVNGQRHLYTGTAVFRLGLKNGSGTTVAVVCFRWASMVNSICSFVPSFEKSVLTLPSAINFFNRGENAVVVALPACRSPEYTGTATRDAWLGAGGDNPNLSNCSSTSTQSSSSPTKYRAAPFLLSRARAR